MIGVLINENLPERVVPVLAVLGVHAVHVRSAGLSGMPDNAIWSYALEGELAVMSKDSDYLHLLLGSPSGKVILTKVGNMPLQAVVTHISSKAPDIHSFLGSDDRVLII